MDEVHDTPIGRATFRFVNALNGEAKALVEQYGPDLTDQTKTDYAAFALTPSVLETLAQRARRKSVRLETSLNEDASAESPSDIAVQLADLRASEASLAQSIQDLRHVSTMLTTLVSRSVELPTPELAHVVQSRLAELVQTRTPNSLDPDEDPGLTTLLRVHDTIDYDSWTSARSTPYPTWVGETIEAERSKAVALRRTLASEFTRLETHLSNATRADELVAEFDHWRSNEHQAHATAKKMRELWIEGLTSAAMLSQTLGAPPFELEFTRTPEALDEFIDQLVMTASVGLPDHIFSVG